MPGRDGAVGRVPAAERAVCFDLDDTLFDHRGAAADAAVQFLRGIGIHPSEHALRCWADAEREGFERWRSGAIGFAEQRRVRLRTVLPMFGHEPPTADADLDRLFGVYLSAYRAAWRPVPGSLRLLQELRTRGYRLGLLTNGAEEQQLDKLARTGLGGALDVVCVSERIGFHKPDPRAFRALTDALHLDPAACVFVGDDAEKDVAGARSVGMEAILVEPGADSADLYELVTAAVGDAAA